jgi:5-hydroxyisourate hydrolase
MISVQVLDGTYGQLATGIRARLECSAGDGWKAVVEAQTSSAGRIEELARSPFKRGLYRIVLDSDSYFAGLGNDTAYPEVVVVFRMRDEFDGCEVKVTLSPHSYSAYFGVMDGQPLNVAPAVGQ